MLQRRLRTRSSLLIGALGAVLALVAAGHHAGEVSDLQLLSGPALALALDGLPAIAIVYAAYWLSATPLSADDRWTVCSWCFAGAALIGGMMAVTVFVRAVEGRVTAEPIFPLLVATEAGAIAGFVAGYNNARARADARRARRVGDAFAFVNDLIRHDLRNDLNVIRAYAQSNGIDTPGADVETGAEAQPVVAEKADEALTRIETTGAIAEVLIGDPAFEPVDFAAMTAEMVARVEDAFGVCVTTDLPDRALVSANAGLRSVVDNVLENAAEHTEADDPRIRAEMTVESETVRLAVRDNGPGIPDSQKEAIFERQSTDSARNGLSLVRTLLEGYGGDVWVEDNDPSGTVVFVELPRATADSGGDDGDRNGVRSDDRNRDRRRNSRDPIAVDTARDSR